MPVLAAVSHRDIIRGGHVEEEKYDATYNIEGTIVHVVAPPPQTKEEKERILAEFHKAGWAIIDELVAKGESV